MWAMFASEPVSRLSAQMTRWPRRRSSSHRCEPRKPAPPVTRQVGIGVKGSSLRPNGAVTPPFLQPAGSVRVMPASAFVGPSQRPDRQRVRRSPAVRRDRGALRRRDAAAPGGLLLRPGARGAQPRDDDGPVPHGRRRGADHPRASRRPAPPSPTSSSRWRRPSSRSAASPTRSRLSPRSRARRATTSPSSSRCGSSRSRSRRSPRCPTCCGWSSAPARTRCSPRTTSPASTPATEGADPTAPPAAGGAL